MVVIVDTEVPLEYSATVFPDRDSAIWYHVFSGKGFAREADWSDVPATRGASIPNPLVPIRCDMRNSRPPDAPPPSDRIVPQFAGVAVG